MPRWAWTGVVLLAGTVIIIAIGWRIGSGQKMTSALRLPWPNQVQAPVSEAVQQAEQAMHRAEEESRRKIAEEERRQRKQAEAAKRRDLFAKAKDAKQQPVAETQSVEQPKAPVQQPAAQPAPAPRAKPAPVHTLPPPPPVPVKETPDAMIAFAKKVTKDLDSVDKVVDEVGASVERVRRGATRKARERIAAAPRSLQRVRSRIVPEPKPPESQRAVAPAPAPVIAEQELDRQRLADERLDAMVQRIQKGDN